MKLKELIRRIDIEGVVDTHTLKRKIETSLEELNLLKKAYESLKDKNVDLDNRVAKAERFAKRLNNSNEELEKRIEELENRPFMKPASIKKALMGTLMGTLIATMFVFTFYIGKNISEFYNNYFLREPLEISTITDSQQNKVDISDYVGGKIAFIKRVDGQKDVFILDPSTGSSINLTGTVWSEHSPSWSSDGKRLIFREAYARGNISYGSFSVIDFEKKETLRQLMETEDDNMFEAIYNAPIFSPDGNSFLFEKKTESGIFIAEIGLKKTTLKHIDISDCIENPQWLDDNTIIYSCRDKIATMNKDGRAIKEYVIDIWNEEYSVSPDKKNIVVTTRDSELNNYTRIAIIEMETGTIMFKTNTKGDESPVWSPDGSTIAFVSYRDDVWNYYLMDADGTNPKKFLDISEDDKPIILGWSPDSSKLLLQDRSYSHPYIADIATGKAVKGIDVPDGDEFVWSPAE
ncbi:hypothetical protein ACFL6I_21210 [candidate division KSB1 bacterium]